MRGKIKAEKLAFVVNRLKRSLTTGGRDFVRLSIERELEKAADNKNKNIM